MENAFEITFSVKTLVVLCNRSTDKMMNSKKWNFKILINSRLNLNYLFIFFEKTNTNYFFYLIFNFDSLVVLKMLWKTRRTKTTEMVLKFEKNNFAIYKWRSLFKIMATTKIVKIRFEISASLVRADRVHRPSYSAPSRPWWRGWCLDEPWWRLKRAIPGMTTKRRRSAPYRGWRSFFHESVDNVFPNFIRRFHRNALHLWCGKNVFYN